MDVKLKILIPDWLISIPSILSHSLTGYCIIRHCKDVLVFLESYGKFFK